MKNNNSDRWRRELLSIAHIQGISWEAGTAARTKALENWIEEWLEEYEYSQSIIKDSLKTDEIEFVKYHCAKEIGEKLLEDVAYLNMKPNKVSVRLMALKKNNV